MVFTRSFCKKNRLVRTYYTPSYMGNISRLLPDNNSTIGFFSWNHFFAVFLELFIHFLPEMYVFLTKAVARAQRHSMKVELQKASFILPIAINFFWKVSISIVLLSNFSKLNLSYVINFDLKEIQTFNTYQLMWNTCE